MTSLLFAESIYYFFWQVYHHDPMQHRATKSQEKLPHVDVWPKAEKNFAEDYTRDWEPYRLNTSHPFL